MNFLQRIRSVFNRPPKPILFNPKLKRRFPFENFNQPGWYWELTGITTTPSCPPKPKLFLIP